MAKPTATTAALCCAAGLGAVVLYGVSDAGIQDLPLGRDAPGTAMTVTVLLPTADGITIGADVRNGQRVIGRVKSMSMAAAGASVQLSLQTDARLPKNSVARVELPSALGNPFVRLSAPTQPSGAVLDDGDVIPSNRTEVGPQIEGALATFGALLSRSGIDQLTTIVTELNKAFGGRSDKIRTLVHTFSALAAKAVAHHDEFEQAMSLAADVSASLTHDQSVVTGYLDAVPRVVAILDVQRAQLNSLFSSTTALAAVANNVLSATDLAAMVGDAGRVITTLGMYNDRLGATLATMNDFLEKFGKSVHGDYLMFDGALDIPGTIDKILTGGLLVNGTPTPAPYGLEGFLSGGLR
ncbi:MULTISPECIES: MCE family protein [Mycobacterium]|uniref:MCE family protein n=1 Tax=Mycobacterium kiyosense TaxID=2871094 RepID=A0A9P3UYT7_9MYCO|nr:MULTISPECIES: MCE family protein [Mycobacterium]BDE12271.1 hypothetical protein MKCMC460_11310 [Mycobacterium sp. 20KCMC460]GLB85123.1 hypothetical protein SRL2020028_43790 [Mycobacterium kiyosense]GLB88509.1 hypothetical protein SRL2020130_13260 [Mycobacterium kiyosense]GLB94862.1 hypothetical protein SRL2020226_16380 [Mycobacterium kiyosense]GLC02024.1 hypothetical protein SRL2020400_26150 [Mycobacterium kiyosense]